MMESKLVIKCCIISMKSVHPYTLWADQKICGLMQPSVIASCCMITPKSVDSDTSRADQQICRPTEPQVQTCLPMIAMNRVRLFMSCQGQVKNFILQAVLHVGEILKAKFSRCLKQSVKSSVSRNRSVNDAFQVSRV